MPEFPPVMTLREASTMLRVPLPTLHDLLNAGALVSYRIGRRRYITGKAALDFIADQHGKPGEEIHAEYQPGRLML